MEHLTVPFYTIVAFFTILPLVIVGMGLLTKIVSTESELDMSSH